MRKLGQFVLCILLFFVMSIGASIVLGSLNDNEGRVQRALTTRSIMVHDDERQITVVIEMDR